MYEIYVNIDNYQDKIFRHIFEEIKFIDGVATFKTHSDFKSAKAILNDYLVIFATN